MTNKQRIDRLESQYYHLFNRVAVLEHQGYFHNTPLWEVVHMILNHLNLELKFDSPKRYLDDRPPTTT